MQGLLIIKVSVSQWWRATWKISVQLPLLLAEMMERSCEGLQSQLWKPSVSLVGGERCKAKPPLVNSHPLNLWQAIEKVRGKSLMWTPPELHVLFKTYLQVFCLFPYKKNRLSNPDSKLQGSSSQEICQCKQWHILTALKCLLLFNEVFLPSFLFIRGTFLTLLYESGQGDAGRWNGDTRVTHFGRGWS